MKKRIVALILVLLLVLTACGGGEVSLEQWQTEKYYQNMELLKYSEMEYERPDMARHDQILENSCRIAREETRIDYVVDAINDYYDFYDWFYTNYSLADIHYCTDLTDLYWEQEYYYCAEQSATVDAGLDELYHALAQSPIRDKLETDAYFGADYFDAYEGESIWDDKFISMMEQETQLINRYYELSEEAMSAAVPDWTPMGELLADLVLLRQKIANYVGYSSYVDFAYDFYYYRDYTPAQVEDYLGEIREHLVPLYVQLDNEVWTAGYSSCSTAETLDYLKEAAKNMGGMVESAYNMLIRYELYQIDYSEKKFNSSFEVFLDYYCEPFIFMNSQLIQADKLTLVHEFGHFANDYACFGSYAGIDVAEVYSQALEYLSLEYTAAGASLTPYKMAESLCVFVEQAAYADFEMRLYSLSAKDVTAENIRALFEQVGKEYGFESWNFDSTCFVDITHFYTSPMYVISYVVSNDAAFQIYQLELATEGAGLELYQNSLTSTESWFLWFLEEQFLASPFDEGRVEKIRQTLEEILK